MPGWGSTLLTLSVLVGCGDELVDDRFSAQQWEYLMSFRLPAADLCPAELGITGARCDDAARLGQALFVDRSYSGAIVVGKDATNGGLGVVGEVGKVACADCHVPDAWFTDHRSRPGATSLGAGWTGRNTPSLVDIGYLDGRYTWDGKYERLWQVLDAPLTKPALLHSSTRMLAEAIVDHHSEAYDAAFDPDLPAELGLLPRGSPALERQIRDAAAKAIELYERRLVSGPSPFDRYLDGEHDALPEPAKRGLELFIGKALCSECHAGPLLGDARYRVTGVAQRRPGVDTAHVLPVDPGRGMITGEAADDGKFRTPGLRHIAETAPYMHGGQIATLANVIEFYRWGGDDVGFVGEKDTLMLPLAISDDEARDLEAFLRALTGLPVAEELRR